MFEQHIQQCERFISQFDKYMVHIKKNLYKDFNKWIKKVPEDELVRTDELFSFLDSVGDLLIRRFTENSSEYRTWQKLNREFDEEHARASKFAEDREKREWWRSGDFYMFYATRPWRPFLVRVMNLLSNIQAEYKLQQDNIKETITVQQNFHAPVIGVAGNVEGNQNIFTSQSIAQASTEIQNLLSTFQSNGLTQEQAEQKVAQDLATLADNDPTALGKLVNWGKSLGNKAAETSVSEVVRRVIKLALNLAGVSMP